MPNYITNVLPQFTTAGLEHTSAAYRWVGTRPKRGNPRWRDRLRQLKADFGQPAVTVGASNECVRPAWTKDPADPAVPHSHTRTDDHVPPEPVLCSWRLPRAATSLSRAAPRGEDEFVAAAPAAAASRRLPVVDGWWRCFESSASVAVYSCGT